MPSGLERPSRLAIIVAIALAASPLPAQERDDAMPGSSFSSAEVRAAVAELAADPNLAAERTVSTLRWRAADQQPNESSGWLTQLLRFTSGVFDWLARSGRVLLWVAGAILAGLLVRFVIRIVRTLRYDPSGPKHFDPPSHVRDLDIRPETLPEDIGRAAATLWDEGSHRAALALLYRGLLSRLVHAHGVAIRASSTEGECLALAEPRLDRSALAYAARLVRTWQNAVYGGLSPATPAVHELCGEFAARIGPKPTTIVAHAS